MECKPVSHAHLTLSPLVISNQLTTCPCIQHGEVLEFSIPCRLFKFGNKDDEGRSHGPGGVKNDVEPR